MVSENGVREEEGRQKEAVHATQTKAAGFSFVLSYTLQHFSFQICLRVNVSFSLFPKLVLILWIRRLPVTTYDEGDNLW